MDMTKLKIGVEALAKEELERANEIKPPFASPHEGWAVIKEEIEEARDAENSAQLDFRRLWSDVRHDVDNERLKKGVDALKANLVHQAAELIQAVAMCDKFEQMLERTNETD